MTEVIPAIMPKNVGELREKLLLVKGAVKSVQLDVMDGTFVPNVSFPYEGRGRLGKLNEELPYWQEFDYEFDLMVARPEEVAGIFLAAGAARIVLHVESSEPALLMRAMEEIKNFDCEAGISANNDTPLEALSPFMYRVNFVQVMGIRKIGFQGELFDTRSLSRIQELRAQYPELIISVDGGVNLETAPKLLEAGANRLVVGSAIFESGNAREAIAAFKSI